MAFQWNLLEDILDSVLHIANSFKIVGAEAKLTVFNAAVDKDKTVFYSAYFRSNQVAFKEITYNQWIQSVLYLLSASSICSAESCFTRHFYRFLQRQS